MRSASAAGTSMVALGTIVNTHGIRGEMRLLPHNPSTTALHSGAEVILTRGAERREAEVVVVRRHKRFLLLTLRGVSSVEDAEALVGFDLQVSVDALPALSRGEIYHFQLIGLTVMTEAGEYIGTVRDMMTTSANDICIVSNGDREVLIPFIAEVVRDIDTAGGRLVIEPLPGLLDL